MRAGDFATAWAIADAILARRDPATRDDPARPYHERWVWSGTPLEGRRVVVRCYHGLGDTLQFARFLPLLAARTAHVTLEVQPELLPLLGRAPGVDLAIPFDLSAPLPAELDIEIMELQHALRVPPPPPIALALPSRRTPSCATGVCWQAGDWDRGRSIPLDMLRPILPAASVSLQRGAAGLPDPLAGTMQMTATAEFIASLRRVITVDSMVAHLAGTLDRPTHLLLKAEADWRWGEGERTAWYPSLHLHRQRHPGDWSAAIASLHASLTVEG